MTLREERIADQDLLESIQHQLTNPSEEELEYEAEKRDQLSRATAPPPEQWTNRDGESLKIVRLTVGEVMQVDDDGRRVQTLNVFRGESGDYVVLRGRKRFYQNVDLA